MACNGPVTSHDVRIVPGTAAVPAALASSVGGVLMTCERPRPVQVFGGRGWSTLYRPGRHLMDVRVCRIYEGTDEILKLKIAANVLGKEYEAFK